MKAIQKWLRLTKGSATMGHSFRTTYLKKEKQTEIAAVSFACAISRDRVGELGSVHSLL